MRARAESSGRVSVVGTKGLKVGLVGADVAMVMRLPLARACSAWMGVYQRGCVCVYWFQIRAVSILKSLQSANHGVDLGQRESRLEFKEGRCRI